MQTSSSFLDGSTMYDVTWRPIGKTFKVVATKNKPVHRIERVYLVTNENPSPDLSQVIIESNFIGSEVNPLFVGSDTPSIKKPLSYESGQLDAKLHSPTTKVDNKIKTAMSCPAGEAPAEQSCISFPCGYPTCVAFNCSEGGSR